MLNEPTLDKLKTLNLFAMANAWLVQRSDAAMNELDFDTRLAMLIDAETLARDNKRITRLLREAKLRIPGACVEDIEFTGKRDLDRAQLRALGTGRWIAEHQNVLITGMTGVGKTYLACALAQLACRAGSRALYRRASRFFDELHLARADGTYARLLGKLAKIDVLVLDDWGLSPLTDPQKRDVLEVLEDRYAVRSTILVSQLPVEKWHEHIADPTIADAVLDRLVHNAHRLTPKGPTRRKTENSNS